MAKTETTAVATKSTKSVAKTNGKATGKAKTAAKPEKKANDYKNYKAKDGTNRGKIHKEKGWKPESTFLTAKEREERTHVEELGYGTPLNASQARILYVLSKAKGPLSRQQITELTGVDNTYVGVWVGRIDAAKRSASEKKWNYTSLVTSGYARWVTVEVENREVECAEITASGRKILEKHTKVMEAKERSTPADEVKEIAKGKK